MTFKHLAAGAALVLVSGLAARADILIKNAPSVRTRAEACSLLASMSSGPDPFPDRKTTAAKTAQKQAVAIARRTRAEICVKDRKAPDPPIDADGSQHFGKMADGKPEGLGVRFYADGSRYIGEWKAGQRQGDGVGLQADGARYVGHFDDDKPHGKGVLQYHAKINMTVADPNKPKS